MYYCKNCKNEFEEPLIEKSSYEDFYGVDGLVSGQNTMLLHKCPHCSEDDFEEMTKCDICEEWNRDCDLIDTDGLVGGNTGYVCLQCARDCEIGGV